MAGYLAAVVRETPARLEDELRRAGCLFELRGPVTATGRYGAGKPIEVALELDDGMARVLVRGHAL